MGKGTIKSGGTNGEYVVTLNFDRAKITAEIARLTASIAALAAYIATLPEGTEKTVAELQKTALEKRIAYLSGAAVPADEDVSAWCADLTENLTGVVGTIEVPGERGVVQIRPGYGGGAAFSAARDGQIRATMAGTPEAAFYNLAMLPGWQKWMPTFRHGVITAIDYALDTCSVTLDAATSSQQSLAVNQSASLTNVPIEYMECDAEAFAIGDAVLVAFTGQDFSAPKVIGFKTHPAGCCLFSEGFTTDAYSYAWNYTSDFDAPYIGSRSWIVPPSWTESVAGAADKLEVEFTYAGGTNAGVGIYFTNGEFSWGRYRVALAGTKDLPEGYLIIDIDIEEISQDPYSYGTPANRAKLDVIIAVEGLYGGAWYARAAALRFNVSSSGASGVFAGDLSGYLQAAYPWAERWRLTSTGVYVNAVFESLQYPNVDGSVSATPEIDARIRASIDAIKICSSPPDGATIGNIIDPSSGSAVSF